MTKDLNCAIIVVDMLDDFVLPSGALYVPGAEKLIPRIKNILDSARKINAQIIYVCDSHTKDDPEFKLWPPHCVSNTSGAAIVEGLTPANTDIVIKKNQLSAYTSPMFRFWLNEWEEFSEQEGLSQDVYICGVAIEYCVKALVMDIVVNKHPHIRANVISDCVSGVELKPGDIIEAIGDIAHRANFIKSDKFVSDLRSVCAGSAKFVLPKLEF
jgi:nicotinamidase/pyrazinamidase